ncbi:hypothetical protein XELAEV_18027243mg [Xenopus laevis]|uniref:Helix-turn-helix domain-containing protein n=1 Tax=Xenopus laevis TaxID=8355 RepID=A0A974HJG8_XENLA|nr:hypothetical protein XELAEV_18027243mg [Xenopus laevis]
MEEFICRGVSNNISNSLHTFRDAINETHDDTKFTMNACLQDIAFLDVTVIRTQDRFAIKIFEKPRDRNQLLSYKSFHQAAVKKSIPTSQFTRVPRITNEPAQLGQDLDKMRGKLSDRGYPQDILDTSLNKGREYLRRTTYRNKTGDRQHLHWHLLRDAYPTISEFEKKPMMSFRKGCNIGTKVTQAEIKPSPRQYTFMGPPKVGMFRCRGCAQ